MNYKNQRWSMWALGVGLTLVSPLVQADAVNSAVSMEVLQQKVSVKGVVVDKTGLPVIGASVVEKGTTNGVITDIDGNFSLTASDKAIIQISYIGYKTQEFTATSQFKNITLIEDNEMLEEVVVVGFGVQKKVNLTGAVGTASAKDLESRPVSNVAQALQGVIPGLNISTQGNGGELNSQKSISIRGTGTIGSSSGSPLILIDGMEGDINTINPQDIENISVLKDAAASSIYGSRAPFGVILITTKKGVEGKTTINYNGNFRINKPVMMPQMANSIEFISLFDDAQYNGSGTHLWSEAYRQQVKDYFYGKTDNSIYGEGSGGKWAYDTPCGNVDWVNEYYRSSAPAHEHNISASGGTNKLTYYISGAFVGQNGFMRYGTEHHKRYNLTGKVSSQLTSYLKIDYSSRYSRIDYDKPTYMDDTWYSNILRRARPVRTIYDPNGYLMSDNNYVAAMSEGGRTKVQKDELSHQVRLTVTPIKDWNIIGEFNMSTLNTWEHAEQFRVYSHYKDNPEKTYRAVTSSSSDNVSEYAYRSTYLNPTVYSNYHFSLDKHNVAMVAGMQLESMKYRYLYGWRSGLVSNELPVINQSTDKDNYSMTGAYQAWSSAGFFGRVNYDWDGKYLFEANLRYDGSSRFRRSNRWVASPSFSLGWNVARESFWKSLEDYIQSFKLRVSYGQLANQNTNSLYPTYQTISTSTGGGYWLQNDARPNVASAPYLISTELTWEKIKSLNIGFDFGAFNNRLTGSFDYFVRKTLDMVGPGIELPETLGTPVPDTNNCDLTTKGWELTIGWRDQIRDFSYGVKLNISDNRTWIDKYPNPTNSIDKYRAGVETGKIYGYKTIGIAKTDEEMQNHLASLPNGGQTALGKKWEAGDIMYADLNGDGKIDDGSRSTGDMGDLVEIGNRTPRFHTGISIDATWKGIDFSMLWQGVLKRDYFPEYNSLIYWGCVGDGQWMSTSLKQHMDYFRPENTSSDMGPNVNAFFPRPLFSNQNHHPQTKYLENAAYMRLKNVQLGYTFPKNLVQKIGIENLRLYISGENLLTITSLIDTLDPESVGIGYRGGTVYPLSKTYSIGLSVNF